MTSEITENNGRDRRCPMLGHDVVFAYCRSPGAPLPCRKIFDCWWETFDVESFMREHYSAEQISQIIEPPQPKLASLVDLIDKARRAGTQRN